MKAIPKKTWLLLSSSFLYAGPPMMTDDPFTPEINEMEINFASELENSDYLTIIAPIVDINYGIYPNIQLTIETAYGSLDNEYKSDGVEVAIKYNFYRSDFFNIAIYPKYHFYPIATPFNEGESYELQIPISLQLNEQLEWVRAVYLIYILKTVRIITK